MQLVKAFGFEYSDSSHAHSKAEHQVRAEVTVKFHTTFQKSFLLGDNSPH
jgi:hypothetical protein